MVLKYVSLQCPARTARPVMCSLFLPRSNVLRMNTPLWSSTVWPPYQPLLFSSVRANRRATAFDGHTCGHTCVDHLFSFSLGAVCERGMCADRNLCTVHRTHAPWNFLLDDVCCDCVTSNVITFLPA